MEKKPVLIILSFFAVYVFWGSTYLWNKMAVTELPPFMLASIRFSTASAIIFVIAVLSGKKLTITKKQLLNTVLAGFLFLAYGNGVFVWALKYVDSGFASLLASLQPLVLLLMMRFVQRKSLKIKSIIGVLLGLFGMYLLVSQKDLQMQEDSWIGILMIMSCIISWSAGSLFVAKADTPSNFFITTGYQMLSAGVILAIGSWAFDESWSEPLSWQLNTQIAIVCLILFGSIAAFTAFNYLLKVMSTEKVATSSYVNPIIALLLGWYFLNESITVQSMIAAAIMLTGVYFINSRKVR
ncbi:permease of the drug/metabolite transporter(DMT) superfamily [Nonlabens ulvanivorans]|uniref:Permease of the drug/metabolite transporter(DMT) superfamily n=2 Tax=Nonlabens ulvanivorans TaxID=906888 RepID=A0A081DFX1_NONUL|nr:EamA family transporter [Nonlabens ulvanivorans]GAK77817.1 permease of the drug/metabolite transporter(DMT) superfamily [Nonlabens ulvanivorans]